MSKYEQYITRKAAIIAGVTPDRKLDIRVPESLKISLKDRVNTGPRIILGKDAIPNSATQIEYGFIWGDTTIGNGKDFGAHKHNFPEVFLFLGTHPEDTTYLGAEGEFWMGEGSDMEKLKFDTSVSIFVPPNTGHFPLILRKVTSPIIMGVVAISLDFKGLTSVPRPPL